MLTTFDAIMTEVLHHEGGYVDHPDDPGGSTKFGIAQRAHPDIDIATLTETEARVIYHDEYWLSSRADELPERIRALYFDMCVNHGIPNAVRLLQEAARAMGDDVVVDGIIGPRTIAAAYAVPLDRLAARRLALYADLVRRDPRMGNFWDGWMRRTFAYIRLDERVLIT
jgi:lysozyme family protein